MHFTFTIIVCPTTVTRRTDNRINNSLHKKVLTDYCDCFPTHKQINKKQTACESWKLAVNHNLQQIAGTPPCLTADLDGRDWTSFRSTASSGKSNAK